MGGETKRVESDNQDGRNFVLIRPSDVESKVSKAELTEQGFGYLAKAVALTREQPTATERFHSLAHLIDTAAPLLRPDTGLRLANEAYEELRQSSPELLVGEASDREQSRQNQQKLLAYFVGHGHAAEAVDLVDYTGSGESPWVMMVAMPEGLRSLNPETFEDIRKQLPPEFESDIDTLQSDVKVFGRASAYCYIAEQTGYAPAFQRAEHELRSLDAENPFHVLVRAQLATGFAKHENYTRALDHVRDIPPDMPYHRDILLDIAKRVGGTDKSNWVGEAVSLVPESERPAFLAALEVACREHDEDSPDNSQN